MIGFFYFTPIVAASIGELMGHRLHDFVASWYLKRHNGRLEPEARLSVIWFSTPFMLAGLVLLGFALERKYHYMIASLGWGMYVFGIMITTVGLNAYVLDSYPEVRKAPSQTLKLHVCASIPTVLVIGFWRSGVLAQFCTNSRRLHHLILPSKSHPPTTPHLRIHLQLKSQWLSRVLLTNAVHQVTWAQTQGAAQSLGVQAAICAGGLVLIFILQIFGKRLRIWSGESHFKTN